MMHGVDVASKTKATKINGRSYDSPQSSGQFIKPPAQEIFTCNEVGKVFQCSAVQIREPIGGRLK
jgi:hypothetical protein